jgi:hypothetical protein
MASILRQPSLVVSEADWVHVESKYGLPLSTVARERILNVTEGYCLLAAGEALAPSTKDARTALKKILKAARSLQEEIRRPDELDGRFYALHLVRNFVRGEGLPDPAVLPFRDPVEAFSSMLSSVVVACERSARELNNPNRAEIKVGAAWDSWIRDLVEILKVDGLPVSVRKDSDKRAKVVSSDFVSLVSALQDFLPTNCRRICSESGLETAISRAKGRLTGQ